jgi:hypothetical protein
VEEEKSDVASRSSIWETGHDRKRKPYPRKKQKNSSMDEPKTGIILMCFVETKIGQP